MKWKKVQQMLRKHGIKWMAVALGAGVIGSSLSAYGELGVYQPKSLGRMELMRNEVIFPGEESAGRDRTNTNGEKDIWEKDEEVLENKMPQMQDQAQ